MPVETIEVSGRTEEEAVQVAAQQLGVAADAVEYEVVEEGAKGFLGLGQAPTFISAHVREGYQAQAKPVPAVEETVEEPAEKPVEEPGAEAEVPVPPPVPPPVPAPVPAPVPTQAAERGPFADHVVSILEDVLKAMEVDAKPVIKVDTEEETAVDIVGKDVALLIGKHGQTLDALQYLISIGANKGRAEKRRVILDAEGYRQRQQELLEKRAREYAQAVKEQGQEAVLEPQSARDRRIIHLALVDDEDIYTYSEGMGENRHVVISPKK